MMTDLLSMGGKPPPSTPPVGAGFNIGPYLVPFFNTTSLSTPLGTTTGSFPVPLASPPIVNSRPYQPVAIPPQAASQLPLYRYIKQQLHLPDMLELSTVSGVNGAMANSVNNNSNKSIDGGDHHPHHQPQQEQYAISVSMDVPHSTTFGPYLAKIGKSRQQLNSDQCIKVKLTQQTFLILYFHCFR